MISQELSLGGTVMFADVMFEKLWPLLISGFVAALWYMEKE